MKIGIDLGGSHIGVAIINSLGEILIKKEVEITKENKLDINNFIITTIINFIEEMLKVSKDGDELEVIGISSPGTISNGHILNAHNLNIKSFNILDNLKEYFNLPIILRNDAKSAAMAEKEYGSLKECKDAVFLTIGTGIGGACFVDGKLLEAKRFSGFELGHVIIKDGGEKCTCGKFGCFESYASISALKREIKRELKIEEEITGKELRKIFDSNEKNLEKVIDKYIHYLAIGISNYINIFEPEKVSLGGSFVYYKKMLPKLKKQIATFNKFDTKNIVLAQLKNDAGIIGSVL